jgi:hypothetical protein
VCATCPARLIPTILAKNVGYGSPHLTVFSRLNLLQCIRYVTDKWMVREQGLSNSFLPSLFRIRSRDRLPRLRLLVVFISVQINAVASFHTLSSRSH